MSRGAVALALLVVVAAAGVVVAQDEGAVVGRPELEVSAPNNTVQAGEQVTLDVYLSNAGVLTQGGPPEFEARVQTARNVQLEIAEDEFSDRLARGLDVKTGQVIAGEVPPGTAGPLQVTIEVNESLAPGTYQIPVRLTYAYTRFVDFGPNEAPQYVEAERTVTRELTLVVESQAEFSLAAADAEPVPAGDTRSYRLALQNTGDETARDVQLSLRAGNSSVFFGGLDQRSPTQSVFVSRLEPGERRVVNVTVGASSEASPGTYVVQGAVRYTNPAGVTQTSDPLRVGVRVGPEQTFAVESVAGSVRVGERGTISGTVVNTGPTAVENAVVVLDSTASNLRAIEREYAVGTLAPGERANYSFEVAATNDTEGGPRSVSLRVRYRNPDGDQRTSDPIDAEVAVAGERTFALRNVTANLRVGQRGQVRGVVVNSGDEPVRDATLVLASDQPALRPVEREYAVGTLDPGEAGQFSLGFEVSNDTDPGPRTLSVRLRYRDGQGDVRTSETLDAQVDVAPEQSFAVRNVSSDLRVRRSGTITGTVVNTGDELVRNAVVTLDTRNPSLVAGDTEYAVGDLPPGDAATFSFDVDATAEAEPGPRQISVGVRYRDPEGDVRRSETLDARVQVAPEADEFRVEAVDATVPQGETAVVEVRVTNVDDQVLTDVSAKLFANDPLSSDDDEAYVQRLEPNESAVLQFAIAADAAALLKEYPVSIDFSYEEPDGDTVLSDTYRVPVRVVEAEGGGILPFDLSPVVATTVGVGVLAVAAVLAFRFRRGG